MQAGREIQRLTGLKRKDPEEHWSEKRTSVKLAAWTVCHYAGITFTLWLFLKMCIHHLLIANNVSSVVRHLSQCSSICPCLLSKPRNKPRSPATSLLLSTCCLFRPMPTARPVVGTQDQWSCAGSSTNTHCHWSGVFSFSDKNLIVSISGDVDEAKALSKPPEDSQGQYIHTQEYTFIKHFKTLFYCLFYS